MEKPFADAISRNNQMDQKKIMTALVPISTRRASITWENKQWLIKEESITVAGHHEDLG
jgi:hypothetical protein